MPQVLLINPVSREDMKAMAKAKRSAAQQRATRKMIAANRARAKAARGASRPKRRASSATPRAKSRATRRPTRAANPAPAVQTRKRRSTKRQATAAGRVLRYRRRKNPVGGIGGFVKGALIPSAVGGAGALALDLAMNMLPLPATLKTGTMRPVVRVAGAIGLGMLASKVASRQVGGQVAAGALTVTLYDLARSTLAKNDTFKKVFGLGEYGSDDARIGEFVGEYVGEQVSGDADQIGYQDSGMQVGELMPDGSVEGYETGVYR